MKALPSNLTRNIIFEDHNNCCLCLNTVKNNALLLHDEIVFESDKSIDSKEILDILCDVLDSETLDNLCSSKMPIICEECNNEALAAYKFMYRCRYNSRKMTEAVDLLYNNLPELKQNFPFKSVFLILNTANSTATMHFDVENAEISRRKAYKRLRSIKNFKSESELNFQDSDSNSFIALEIEPDVEKHNDVVHINAPVKSIKSRKHKPKKICTSEMRVDETEFRCKKCLLNFPSSQHLRKHYVRVHAPKKCKCPKCPRSYGSESILKQHQYNSHTPAICSECGKKYENRHSLKRHEMGHNIKMTCEHCGRVYKHQKSYDRHISQSTCQQREKRTNFNAKFICDYCNKRFTNKGTLRVHIQFEHGNAKSYSCSWCSKKFHAQSRLKAHIVKHTQDKKFSCDLCGGKFVTKESLVYHTRIHSGEKPYQCDLCDVRFISSSRRADHIKRHHTPASLECEICKSKFKVKSCLNKHMKRHFNPKSRLGFDKKNKICE